MIGRSNDFGRRAFCSRRNLERFMHFVRSSHRRLVGSIVCLGARGRGVPVRITVVCGAKFSRGVRSCIGGVGAVRNNARLTNFHHTLAHALGGCTRSDGVLRGIGMRVSNSSFHRNLATIVSMGMTRPRFRKRAGAGLKGGRMVNTISRTMNRMLGCCLRRRPGRTGTVMSGIVLTTATHRTTHGTHRVMRHGSPVSNNNLPNGLTSYSSGSPRGYRLFLIRKSSTNNATGRNHGHTFRTVLPLHNGVLGMRGTVCRGTLRDRRVHGVCATLNIAVKARRSDGTTGVSGLHCRGVVVVASTSISKSRVSALVVAFFFHCVPRVVRGNCLCVTAPPLCLYGGKGVRRCY